MSARRRTTDEEVGEPAVHDLRVLDVRKVTARIQPSRAGARKSRCRVRAVRGGNGRILAAVDEQHGFKNVKNLAGGLDSWARTVDPTMRRY